MHPLIGFFFLLILSTHSAIAAGSDGDLDDNHYTGFHDIGDLFAGTRTSGGGAAIPAPADDFTLDDERVGLLEKENGILRTQLDAALAQKAKDKEKDEGRISKLRRLLKEEHQETDRWRKESQRLLADTRALHTKATALEDAQAFLDAQRLKEHARALKAEKEAAKLRDTQGYLMKIFEIE